MSLMPVSSSTSSTSSGAGYSDAIIATSSRTERSRMSEPPVCSIAPMRPPSTAARGERPSTDTVPASGSSSPSSMSIVVDFPAPLGPSSATVSPASMSTSMPRTACTSPPGVRNDFVRPCSRMPVASAVVGEIMILTLASVMRGPRDEAHASRAAGAPADLPRLVPMPAYIAVLGPGECVDRAVLDAAAAVGAGLARRGAVVVCGGRGGAMEAVCRGAVEAGGTTLGILPGDDRSSANAWVSVAVATGMGELRNGLVVRAADAVIAVAGAYGTLSEIALALQAGKRVVGLGTWDIPGVIAAADPEEAVELALALRPPPAALAGASLRAAARGSCGGAGFARLR